MNRRIANKDQENIQGRNHPAARHAITPLLRCYVTPRLSLHPNNIHVSHHRLELDVEFGRRVVVSGGVIRVAALDESGVVERRQESVEGN